MFKKKKKLNLFTGNLLLSKIHSSCLPYLVTSFVYFYTRDKCLRRKRSVSTKNYMPFPEPNPMPDILGDKPLQPEAPRVRTRRTRAIRTATATRPASDCST